MKLRIRAIAAFAVGVALVGVSALPANAVSTTGSFSCGGSTYPTVQYKNNGPTEVTWQTVQNGTFLKNPAQYLANTAVYNQSPRQAPSSFYSVNYGSGTTFAYGVNAFCG
jgi:hypothetical protein